MGKHYGHVTIEEWCELDRLQAEGRSVGKSQQVSEAALNVSPEKVNRHNILGSAT